MEKWYKKMSDKEIYSYLMNMANESIELMENEKVNESLEVEKELNILINELLEYISSMRGFYYGTPKYDYFELVMNDLRGLKFDTDKALYRVFKEKELKR